jgi:hypothetical protein
MRSKGQLMVKRAGIGKRKSIGRKLEGGTMYREL